VPNFSGNSSIAPMMISAGSQIPRVVDFARRFGLISLKDLTIIFRSPVPSQLGYDALR